MAVLMVLLAAGLAFHAAGSPISDSTSTQQTVSMTGDRFNDPAYLASLTLPPPPFRTIDVEGKRAESPAIQKREASFDQSDVAAPESADPMHAGATSGGLVGGRSRMLCGKRLQELVRVLLGSEGVAVMEKKKLTCGKALGLDEIFRELKERK